MEFFNSYINNIPTKPNDRYRNDMQQFMNDSWENTTLLDNIILEDFPRTNKYDKHKVVEVGIDTVSEFTTSTAKIQGNYIDVTFKDCSFELNRGSMFYRQSDKSYYMVYQGTNAQRTISKIKAIKCNNTIKWIDKDTLQVIQYPCSLGYELSSTTSSDTKMVSIVNGRLTAMVFGNTDTYKLEYNQRFIFNGVPYRINGVRNYEQDDIDNGTVNILYLYLEKTSVSIEDDLVNNIANAFTRDYSIKLDQDKIEQINGFVGTIIPTVYFKDEIVEFDNIQWKTDNSKVVTVDNGVYTIKGKVGDMATITAYINDDIYAEINVKVISNTSTVKELIINPFNDIIDVEEDESIIFDCGVYVNNILYTDSVTCTGDWEDDKHYTLENIGNNKIKLTCIKRISKPLILTFRSGDLTEQISVKLKGLW